MANNNTMTTSGSTTASMGTSQYGLAKDDPFAKLLGAQGNQLSIARAVNSIITTYGQVASPANPQMSIATYIQDLLRKKGLSKGKTDLGIFSTEDASALIKATQTAVGSNINNIPISDWLVAILEGMPVSGGKTKDTTPQYNKQISTAVHYKDAGDAAFALTNAWFLNYGLAPSQDQIDVFKKKWNAEVDAQAAQSITDTETTFVIKKDAKGRIVYGKDGQPVYTTVNKTKTAKSGEDFTAEEQQKFMADYLVNAYPTEKWDVTTLGGQAKSLYDELALTAKSNYLDTPTLADMANDIRSALATNDTKISTEVMNQAKQRLRMVAAKSWQGIADDILAGADASQFISPVTTALTKAFEGQIDANDPLVKKIMNYKDKGGTVRMANADEINTMILEDPRYWKTSAAKSNMLGAGQALMKVIGR